MIFPKPILLIASALIILGAAAWGAYSYMTPHSPPVATSTQNGGGATTTGGSGTDGGGAASGGTAGAHCGGFIRNAPTCATGYHCVLTPGRPDTGGTCVAGAEPVACPALAKQCPDGSYVSPSGPNCEYPACPGSASGVRGTVMLGPTCPVERMPPDPQCADKPYATTVTARRASGTVAGSVRSLADGTFTLALPAGTYTLSASGGQTLPRCADTSVTVPKAGYATTSISCDTGIR